MSVHWSAYSHVASSWSKMFDSKMVLKTHKKYSDSHVKWMNAKKIIWDKPINTRKNKTIYNMLRRWSFSDLSYCCRNVQFGDKTGSFDLIHCSFETFLKVIDFLKLLLLNSLEPVQLRPYLLHFKDRM